MAIATDGAYETIVVRAKQRTRSSGSPHCIARSLLFCCQVVTGSGTVLNPARLPLAPGQSRSLVDLLLPLACQSVSGRGIMNKAFPLAADALLAAVRALSAVGPPTAAAAKAVAEVCNKTCRAVVAAALDSEGRPKPGLKTLSPVDTDPWGFQALQPLLAVALSSLEVSRTPPSPIPCLVRSFHSGNSSPSPIP